MQNKLFVLAIILCIAAIIAANDSDPPPSATKQEQEDINKIAAQAPSEKQAIVKEILGYLSPDRVQQILGTEKSQAYVGRLSLSGFRKFSIMESMLERKVIHTPETRKDVKAHLLSQLDILPTGVNPVFVAKMRETIERTFSPTEILARQSLSTLVAAAPEGQFTAFVYYKDVDQGILHVKFACISGAFKVAPKYIVSQQTKRSWLRTSTRQDLVELPATVTEEDIIQYLSIAVHARRFLGIPAPPALPAVSEKGEDAGEQR